MNINDLPPEICNHIFKYVNLKDKYLNCKLVCKRWNEIIKNLKEQCLIVSDRLCINEVWFLKNEFVNNLNQIYPLNYNFLMDQQIKTTFSNLKYLYMNYSNYDDELDFDQIINQLIHIEQLQLENVNCKNETCLKLSNLRLLSLSSITNKTIKFNLPNLVYLKLNSSGMKFEFDNPIKVTYLYIDECKKLIYQFINLEFLISKSFNKLQPNELFKLTKLKVIHNIGYSCTTSFSSLPFFCEFYKAKQSLKKDNLNIYLSGLHSDLFSSDCQRRYGPNLTRFYSENYSNIIDNQYWVEKFNFDRFVFEDDKIPDDLFIKLPNIRHVYGELIENEELFLEFLNRCKHLTRLNILLPFKDNNLYDKLALSCRRITHLVIGIEDRRKELNLDFIEFILKLEYLSDFEVSRLINYDLIIKSFNQLKYLRFFKFDNDLDFTQYCFVTIHRKRSGSFKLDYKNLNKIFTNLDQLIEYLSNDL